MTRPPFRFRPYALLLLSSVLLLSLGGCAGSKESDGESKVPADFQLEFGSGGGFTGRWEGHTVGANGVVTGWSRDPGGEKVPRELGTLPAGELTSLWKSIREHGFFDLDPGEPGNYSRMIRVTADGTTHEVTWTPAMGQQEDPGAAGILYRRFMEAVGGVAGK